MRTLQPHPASELFPLLQGAEYESFKADVQQRGLLEAIWLCDGKILDGRNRYRACADLGIAPTFRTYNGDSPAEFAWSMNGKRRHLTQSQLAAIATKMLPALQIESQKREYAGKPLGSTEPRGRSAVQAAEIVGVGHAQVNRANRIKKEDPALFAKIEAGEITVNKALTEIKSKSKQKEKPVRMTRQQRADKIRELALDGNTSKQIATIIGMNAEVIGRYAREFDITLADKQIGRVHKIKIIRVIENTVHGLAGYAQGLKTINGSNFEIDRSSAGEWAESLKTSLIPIQQLRRQLMRHANGN